MSETDHDHKHTLLLQRVRCGQCGFPLVQILFSSSPRNEGEIASQPLPASSYRSLTDATPLCCCPHCQTPLSSSTMTLVRTRTRAPEGSHATLRRDDR